MLIYITRRALAKREASLAIPKPDINELPGILGKATLSPN